MKSVSPRGRARRAGEDEVDDVLGEIVVSARDEDLRSLDGVRPVRVSRRRGTARADVAAGLRLGEAHRATPAPAEHPVAVELLLLGRPEELDDLCRAVGEARVHVERVVGPAEQLLDEELHRARRASPAVCFVYPDRLPAGLVELGPRFLEAARGLHLAVLEPTPLGVADGVQGAGYLANPAITLGEGALHLVRAPGLERRLGEMVADLELLEQQEKQLSKVRLVAVDGLHGLGHGQLSCLRGYQVRPECRPSPRKLRMNAHSVAA